MSSDAVPRPLEGVRVLEFSQAIAAPTCGRYLSALGAEVIKMENLLAPDLIRALGPSWLPPDVPPLIRLDVPMGGEYVSGELSCGLSISVNDPASAVADPHLAYRGFWRDIEVAGERFRSPGAPARYSSLEWDAGPAPSLGEHTAEILGELGFTPARLAGLAAAGVI